MIESMGIKFWLIVVPITLAFTILAIRLFKNISLKNMNKKWVRFLMNAGPEYRSVVEARDFLTELEEFKKG